MSGFWYNLQILVWFLHLGFVCLQEVFTLGSWGPLILSWSLCSVLVCIQEVYRLMTIRSVSLHLGFVCLQEVFTLGSWGQLILSWSLCSEFVCIQEVYSLMTMRSVVSKLIFLYRVCLHSRSLQTSTLRSVASLLILYVKGLFACKKSTDYDHEVGYFSADLIC